MAVVQKPQAKARYVDLPDLPETFSDSIHAMVWDGQTLRIEFCVTRYPQSGPDKPAEAKRYPACRMVMTPAVAVDLFNRLQQTMSALQQAGVVAQQKPPPTRQ
jgi:hypothetical protein